MRTADVRMERARIMSPTDLSCIQQLVTHKGEELTDCLIGAVTDVAFDNVAVVAIVKVLGERGYVTPALMGRIVMTVEMLSADVPSDRSSDH